MSLPESIRRFLEEVAGAKGFFATTAGVIRWDERELVVEIGVRAIALPSEEELVTLRLWQHPRGQAGEEGAGLGLTAEIEGEALGISLTAWLPDTPPFSDLPQADVTICVHPLHEIEPDQLLGILKAAIHHGIEPVSLEREAPRSLLADTDDDAEPWIASEAELLAADEFFEIIDELPVPPRARLRRPTGPVPPEITDPAERQARALAIHEASLDRDPTNFAAFEAVERILVKARDWPALEAAYRRMLKRAVDLSPKVRIVLWRHLAELYRVTLNDRDKAIAAFEALHTLAPPPPASKARLAELYAQTPDRRAAATALQHELVTELDKPMAAIRALRELYAADGNEDAEFVMCAALVAADSASDEERGAHLRLAAKVPPRATGQLTLEDWLHIAHPDLTSPIERVASKLYLLARDLFLVQPKELELTKRDGVDVRASELACADYARYAGHLLGSDRVDLYVRSGSAEAFTPVNTRPVPSLVVGRDNPVIDDPAQARLAFFQLGRALAFLQPGMFLARGFRGAGFRDLLSGLCRVFALSIDPGGDAAAVDGWAERLRQLPEAAKDQLEPLIGPAHAALSESGPLARYCAAVEHTANAAGLLVCGDLDTARTAIRHGGPGASDLPRPERLREVSLFWVSRTHLELRQTVGAALVAADEEEAS